MPKSEALCLKLRQYLLIYEEKSFLNLRTGIVISQARQGASFKDGVKCFSNVLSANVKLG
jgi:hypothetical protein